MADPDQDTEKKPKVTEISVNEDEKRIAEEKAKVEAETKKLEGKKKKAAERQKRYRDKKKTSQSNESNVKSHNGNVTNASASDNDDVTVTSTKPVVTQKDNSDLMLLGFLALVLSGVIAYIFIIKPYLAKDRSASGDGWGF